MEAMQALVLTDSQLRQLLSEAACEGAMLAVAELRADLQQSPDDVLLQKLRAYIADAVTLPNPHEFWAHSGLIRAISQPQGGKPKSAAWFAKFQRESGLAECHSRASPGYGRRREWSFADIRLAWNAYYRR
jgi:hypothetical protein